MTHPVGRASSSGKVWSLLLLLLFFVFSFFTTASFFKGIGLLFSFRIIKETIGNHEWSSGQQTVVSTETTSQRSENTCQWNIQPHMRHFHHLSLRPRDHHGRRNRKSLQAIDWEDWGKAVSSRHDKALALMKSQQRWLHTQDQAI